MNRKTAITPTTQMPGLVIESNPFFRKNPVHISSHPWNPIIPENRPKGLCNNMHNHHTIVSYYFLAKRSRLDENLLIAAS
jgi:hypothetical protein